MNARNTGSGLPLRWFNPTIIMTISIGYCTNVHAGPDLAQTGANLDRYALAVKRRFSPDTSMGIGLWLAASAARLQFEYFARGAERVSSV